MPAARLPPRPSSSVAAAVVATEEDVHRRRAAFVETDEKQQSSEIIDFVRRGTRRRRKGWTRERGGAKKPGRNYSRTRIKMKSSLTNRQQCQEYGSVSTVKNTELLETAIPLSSPLYISSLCSSRVVMGRVAAAGARGRAHYRGPLFLPRSANSADNRGHSSRTIH